ncbi:unnamed protein product [Trifolium pratense]|uniref:Uncharacterized protein n=1 Tax=Trifolium pratense TaxID=57577 RepID=A0ACB0LXX2_TRIPR|nr:unnamed protein product [Trifolium pratense]
MSFTKGPSFRIIIVQDKKTYKIPKLYREKYWKGIPNPIILRLRNGFEQEISWVERNGEILFQKNWKTFSKDLNLSHGCVLTFKYIGGSHFKVKVFGPKCLEINYSKINSENEEDVEAREKAKEIIEEVSDEIPMQAQRKRNGKRKFQGRNRGNMVKKVKKYPTNEDVNVENPFFEVVMTNFYVKGCFLFSREYLNNFRGIATLRVGKDTPMEVKIRFDDNYKKAMMCAGWKLFSKKYNLQVDDTCKFVMTQRRPPSFIVIINRPRKGKGISCDNNIAKRRYLGGTSRSRPRVYYVEDSESGIMVKHFKFKIYVKDDYNYPSLPMEFMNIVGCDKNVNVELKMGRRSWFVKVNYFDSMKSSRFGKGWRPFIQECNLIGEICSFNLIDEINLVFNVSVVRKNH